jgi:tetratricopeptide (TPR) repeat protein
MVIKLEPKKHGNYFGRGLVYLAIGQPDKALADFNKCILADPKNKHYYHYRSLAYFGLGETAKGESDASRVKELLDAEPE